MDARIAIEPGSSSYGQRQNSDGMAHAGLERTVLRAGGTVVSTADANGLVWLSDDPFPLMELLDEFPAIQWVQLPLAGVERFASAGLFKRSTVFTCAKGSFGIQAAEHALTLALACLRHLVPQARTRHWLEIETGSLYRKRVSILGGGGIATTAIELLQPFQCDIRVIRRKAIPSPGARATLVTRDLHAVLPDTDVLFLALALTPETVQLIGERELFLLPRHAVVVNVARGAHIDTEAMVDALRDNEIAAAGLDVTDPEPLPDDHPLWRMDNALITSHCAESFAFVSDRLSARVQENVGRLCRGEPLAGRVDPVIGY